MSDIPAEYAQFHRELQQAIDNPQSVSATNLVSAADTIAANAGTTGSESELLEEINKMSGAAASVDKSFADVGKLFFNVRNGLSLPAVKADMRVLEDKWNGYHQTYKGLIWKSREVAGKAQAAADDFARDFVLFLGDDAEPINSKKAEIRLYIDELTRDGKASAEMAQGFADLRGNIINLVDDWKALVKKYNIDAISARVEKLKQEIDALSRTLVDLDVKIAQLTAALSVSVGFTGVINVFFLAFPFWSWLVLFPGLERAHQQQIDLNKAKNERNEVNTKYYNKVVEYTRALPELIQVQELQGTLKQSESDINNIIDRIAGFATVWAMIRTDLQAISEKLDYVVGTESERLFKSRLNSTAKLYALLGKALYRYQITVTAEHPVFVNMVQRA